MADILATQGAAEITTLAILIASFGLSIVISMRYAKRRSAPLLYWSTGMWFFTIGVLLEVLFTLDIYSESLIVLYLFVVALIVEFLACGSIQFAKSQLIRRSYYAFMGASTAFLAYSLLATNTGNILTNWVVAGAPPLIVIIASSLITFPAAAVLIIFAYKSYMARKDPRLLSIIAGVVVVSVAGTLYIVQYPAFLYVSEVIGIALLWYGFI